MRRSRKPLLGIFLNRGFESLPLRLSCSPDDGHSGSSSQPPHRILGYTEGVRRVLHTIRANTQSASSSRAALALSSIDEGAREQPPHFLRSQGAGFRIPPSPPLLLPHGGQMGSSFRIPPSVAPLGSQGRALTAAQGPRQYRDRSPEHGDTVRSLTSRPVPTRSSST